MIISRISIDPRLRSFSLLAVGFLGPILLFVSKVHADPSYVRHLEALERRLPSDDFHILVEEPFVVIGDESPEVLKHRAKSTIRWAVDRIKAEYFAKDPDHIIDIWLFKDKESYEKHAEQLFGRKPHTPYGYYSPRRRALVMNISTGGGTLVHEIVHPFMAANFADCPSWFNEGLASLYEQCGDRDGKIVGYTNWRLAGLQRAIRNDGCPTFRELCETTTDEFYGDRSGTNYAQARYLCYYLQEHGKLRAYYHAFVRNAADDPSGYATLQQVLGERDMEDFQKRWEKYVLELRYR